MTQPDFPFKPKKARKIVEEIEQSERTKVAEKKPNGVWNEKLPVEQDEPKKIVKGKLKSKVCRNEPNKLDDDNIKNMVVSLSSPNDDSHKKIAKRKNRLVSGIIVKKARIDCSIALPQIHMVNLEVLLHESAVDESYASEIHSNEHNHNLNITTEIKEPSVSDPLPKMEELEEVEVKIEPKVLEDDPRPIELATFITQPDLDIKQDLESDSTTLQWIDEKAGESSSSTSDRLQTQLITQSAEKSEKVQPGDKEPENTREEVEKQNEEVDAFEQTVKAKKLVEMMKTSLYQRIKVLAQEKNNVSVPNIINQLQEKLIPLPPTIPTLEGVYPEFLGIGPITVVKESNVFTFHCKIQNCNYSSNDRKAFATHCEIIHKDYIYILCTRTCNVCSIKFECKRKFVTVHDIYLHIVTEHKDFFEHESAISFKLAQNVPNVISQTYDNSGSKTPFLITNVASLASKSDMKQIAPPSPSIPLLTDDKQLTAKQLALNGDHSKCTSVVTDVSATDVEKQNIKSSKTLVDRMKSSLLNALYKAPKYNCNLSDVVLPYNCEDDGFPSCPFKTLYFDKYLKHMEIIHHVDGLSPFSSDHELQRERIMKRWLAKDVGPFQCRYCKKATVTYQEMGSHQTVAHAQKKSWFYYRKFVENDTVTSPEQVNLEDPSFINHVVHLPDQVELCYFKLPKGLLPSTPAKLTDRASKSLLPQLPVREINVDLEQQKMLLNESEIFSLPTDNEAGLLNELDPLCLDEKPPEDIATCDNSVMAVELQAETVKIIPEQINLENPSVINHMINLPDQAHLCNFDLTDSQPSSTSTKLLDRASKPLLPLPPQSPAKDSEIEADQSKVLLDEPEVFSMLADDKVGLFSESDPLCLKEEPLNDTDNEEQLQCKWKGCYQTYHSQKALIIHIKKNHMVLRRGEKFTCFWINCPRKLKPYSAKHSLLKHMRTHSGEELHKCFFQGCNKVFSRLDNLKFHQTSHIGEKRYFCEFSNCSKSFSSIFDQTKHQRTHYVILECKWKGCYQTHDSQTALVKHIKKDHLALRRGEGFACFWINCPRKSKPLSSKNNLLKHMRIHTGEKPYKCPFQGCNKTFAMLENRKVHQRRHTGEKPYLCEFPNCLKSFSSSSDKTKHQKMHYEVKSCVCQVTGCSKKYIYASSLWLHMKNHTAEEQLQVKQKLLKNKQK